MSNMKNLNRISRKLALLTGIKTSDSKDQELKRLFDDIDVPDKKINAKDVVDGDASDLSGPKVTKDKELSSMEDHYTVEDKKVKKEKALKDLQDCLSEYVDGDGTLDKVKFHEEAAEKAGVPKETIDSLFKGGTLRVNATGDEDTNWGHADADVSNISSYQKNLAFYVKHRNKEGLRDQIDGLKRFLDVLAETVGA